MARKRVTRTTTTQTVPDVEYVEEENMEESAEFALHKVNQVVWFFANIIAILLALRFFFLLAGANVTGVVAFIYSLTDVFVAPFTGIFPAPSAGGAYFSTATILAIVMYYLIASLITGAINLLSPREE